MRRKSPLERDLQVFRTDSGPDGYFDPVWQNLWRLDWKSLGFDYCCIYAIGPHKRWPMKIGVSVSPAKRLLAIQTAVWEPLKVHKLFFAHSISDARRVETRVHDDLERQQKALYGEWFDCRPDDAADAIQFAALGEGVELSTEPWCGREHPVMVDFCTRMARQQQKAELRTTDARLTRLG